MYSLSEWPDVYFVVSDMAIPAGLTIGTGVSEHPTDLLIASATAKWGSGVIPYAHQHSGAYNCIGFSDDIVHLALTGVWNPRISSLHQKFGIHL